MDNGVFDQRAAWVLPGFPLVVVALHLLYTICLDKKSGVRTRLFALCVLPYVLKHAYYVLPGLYYDVPALLLQIVFFLEMLRWIDRWFARSMEDVPITPSGVMIVAVPAVISFLIKPIGALSLAVAGVLVMVAIIRDFPFRRLWVRRSLVTGGLPGLLVLGWMARNAVLSGWLLFPAPYGRIPVDWVVPSEPFPRIILDQQASVSGMQDIIRAWARYPGADYARVMHAPLHDWVPAWYVRYRQSIEIRWLFPSGLLLSLFLLVYGWLRKTPERFVDAGLFVLTVGLIGFWFWMAPDLRFGDGLFWVSFAVAASGILENLWISAGRKWGMAAGLLISASLAHSVVWMMLQGFGTMGSRRVGYSNAWPTSQVTLDNGQNPPLLINVPTRSDRSGDCDLPATPCLYNQLLARQPGSLRQGFKIDH
jgi:hypothetical protein